MKRLLLAVVGASCLVLCACQDNATPVPAGTTFVPKPPTATSVPPVPTEMPTRLPTSSVLTENAQKYLLMLEENVPLLTNDELFAIELGQGVCTRTDFGWMDADIRAWLQLTTGQHIFDERVMLSDDEANRVVAAARGYLC